MMPEILCKATWLTRSVHSITQNDCLRVGWFELKPCCRALLSFHPSINIKVLTKMNNTWVKTYVMHKTSQDQFYNTLATAPGFGACTAYFIAQMLFCNLALKLFKFFGAMHLHFVVPPGSHSILDKFIVSFFIFYCLFETQHIEDYITSTYLPQVFSPTKEKKNSNK